MNAHRKIYEVICDLAGKNQAIDLRESGAIEQDADLVCFIHREDYYDRDCEEKGIAELIIAKNRHGESDTVRMAWLGQFTLFANLEQGTKNGVGPF